MGATERSLRREVSAYMVHFHGQRNHQGLDNKLIDEIDPVGS